MAKDRIITKSTPFWLVMLGGSTGSIDVLTQLLPALPTPLPYVLVLVLHRKNTSDSNLAQLFSLKTQLLVREVEDKDTIRLGTIYLAPADYHLLFESDGTFALDDSEKINFSRPSIDVTFEAAADVFGTAVVGILLSGANADGVAGLRAIQQAGGLTIAQQPETALVAYMPQQAIQAGVAQKIMTVDELAFMGLS
jgi:two-component system, chemotaxis family, protein-glutamate methylesterase/glutaminase